MVNTRWNTALYPRRQNSSFLTLALDRGEWLAYALLPAQGEPNAPLRNLYIVWKFSNMLSEIHIVTCISDYRQGLD
jgi:hypothetical protein